MIIVLSFLCAGLILALLTLLVLTRRLLRHVEASMRTERRVLHGHTGWWSRYLGLDSLVHASNLLIDKCRFQTATHSNELSQVESTLGVIQEAVLVFDTARRVEFANESAQRLFPYDGGMLGAPLESILRSSSLLEFLDAYREDIHCKRREINLEWGGEPHWFEASCTQIYGLSGTDSISTLLVLHDITRLKGLEEMRREFVANVSHELRTPLTVIKGFAETLVEDEASLNPATRRRFLNKITSNTQRLYLLVEDLLTLSRLESGPDQGDFNKASLGVLFAEIIENNQGRLKPQGQAILMEIDPQIQPFAFDLFRINQVFDNLVENAFRYAPDFTRLVLRAQLDADQAFVKCSVADDGPGIPEQQLPHIFERFYRVDKGRSRERGGTGLGLSIAKHIVQLHGGTVAAKSTVGKGTEIYFTLPYRAVAKELPVT